MYSTYTAAELVYSGPKNIAPYMFLPLSIDLNDDGIVDITLGFTLLESTDIPPSSGHGSTGGFTGNNYVWRSENYAYPFDGPGGDPALQATAGEWMQGAYHLGNYGVQYIEQTWTGWRGLWADSGSETNHIAVLFRDADNQLRRGWVRVRLPNVALTPSPVILDWYYESTPLPEPDVGDIQILSEGNIHLTFSGAQKGLPYVFEETSNLVSGIWTTTKVLNGQSESMVITNGLVAPHGFWRIRRQ